jgi:ADP-heptose:LPS heptosyltransferase
MSLTLIKNSIKKQFNLEDYHSKHNQILFARKSGGFGDILMMRMIFEDIKKSYPEFLIHWAIPKCYHDIGSHPYVDKILDYNEINKKDYINSINLSEACIVYEMQKEKECFLHRSDIWANHCGVNLSNHKMYLNPDLNSIDKIKSIIKNNKKFKNSKTIFLCPFSAHPAKDLTDEQVNFIINYINKLCMDCFVIHNQLDLRVVDKKFPLLTINNFKDVIAAHYIADAIISVDTGHLHCAAGLGKPLLSIFSYVDGDIYCKYYDTIILQKHRKNKNWPCDGPCWNLFKCSVPHDTDQKPCMTMLTHEEISQKIDLLLSKYNI